MSDIRKANSTDIPRMIDLISAVHRQSHYPSLGVSVDPVEANNVLLSTLIRHGQTTEGGSWSMVAEQDDAIYRGRKRVVGFIVGYLARVGLVGNMLSATDLFWITSHDAHPLDARKLMESMVSWAKLAPLCVEVKCATLAVVGDPARAGKLLQRMGMKPFGNVYQMAIERLERKAA